VHEFIGAGGRSGQRGVFGRCRGAGVGPSRGVAGAPYELLFDNEAASAFGGLQAITLSGVRPDPSLIPIPAFPKPVAPPVDRAMLSYIAAPNG
jgi:hypothetical protein